MRRLVAFIVLILILVAPLAQAAACVMQVEREAMVGCPMAEHAHAQKAPVGQTDAVMRVVDCFDVNGVLAAEGFQLAAAEGAPMAVMPEPLYWQSWRQSVVEKVVDPPGRVFRADNVLGLTGRRRI